MREVVLGLVERLGGGPHPTLVESGEDLDGLAPIAARRQVTAPEPHGPPGGRLVQSEVFEQIAVAGGVRHLGGDVSRSIDVDDAVPAVRRTEHREVATAALLQLDVHARAAPTQRTDDLADQALSLDPAHPRHDREVGVEIEREGVLPGFDDQPLHSHLVMIGNRSGSLKENGPNGPHAGRRRRPDLTAGPTIAAVTSRRAGRSRRGPESQAQLLGWCVGERWRGGGRGRRARWHVIDGGPRHRVRGPARRACACPAALEQRARDRLRGAWLDRLHQLTVDLAGVVDAG